MESFASDRRSSSQPKLTEAQLERQTQRHMLQLSRTRVLHDIETSRNPRHVEMLKASLAYLDTKLKELGDAE